MFRKERQPNHLEENSKMENLKMAAASAQALIVGTGLISEAKNFGVHVPSIMSSYGSDFALPYCASVAINLLPFRIAKTRLARFGGGFAICVGTEILQKADLMHGVYDKRDILVFAAGAAVTYTIDKVACSELSILRSRRNSE